MQFLDAKLQTPTMLSVGTAIFMSGILAVMLAGFFQLVGFRPETNPDQRFWMFFGVFFVLNIINAMGVSPANTPRAYWTSFFMVLLLQPFVFPL